MSSVKVRCYRCGRYVGKMKRHGIYRKHVVKLGGDGTLCAASWSSIRSEQEAHEKRLRTHMKAYLKEKGRGRD